MTSFRLASGSFRRSNLHGWIHRHLHGCSRVRTVYEMTTNTERPGSDESRQPGRAKKVLGIDQAMFLRRPAKQAKAPRPTRARVEGSGTDSERARALIYAKPPETTPSEKLISSTSVWSEIPKSATLLSFPLNPGVSTPMPGPLVPSLKLLYGAIPLPPSLGIG